MCAYSFSVFISLFQLLPAAPYHILDLGGSMAEAGLFHGSLTFASAMSAPFTGMLGDRFGQRRVLIVLSLILAGFAASYAVITSVGVLLTVVFFHGLFWSGLLSASGAYLTRSVPESRRAEGIGYWGLASVVSIALAPPIGFLVYHRGWAALCAEIVVLNVLMAAIAWWLPDDRAERGLVAPTPAEPPRLRPHFSAEWRVVALSVSMGVVSFGYGALTSFSALFADELHIGPRSLFLTVMALAILFVRLVFGRVLDQIGHRRVLLPCFTVPAVGLLILAFAQGRPTFILSAVIYGLGFGLIYPSFTAYVIRHMSLERHGAAFGAILAAFDTGIGSGASGTGWLIHQFGFRTAFGVTAVVAAMALPYFLVAERKLGFADAARS